MKIWDESFTLIFISFFLFCNRLAPYLWFICHPVKVRIDPSSLNLTHSNLFSWLTPNYRHWSNVILVKYYNYVRHWVTSVWPNNMKISQTAVLSISINNCPFIGPKGDLRSYRIFEGIFMYVHEISITIRLVFQWPLQTSCINEDPGIICSAKHQWLFRCSAHWAVPTFKTSNSFMVFVSSGCCWSLVSFCVAAV